MKKAPQTAAQAREAISKFFSRTVYKSPTISDYSPPLGHLIFEMWLDALAVERDTRAKLFAHKSKESKEGQRQHRRKFSAEIRRALYGKEEDVTESDKLSPSKLGGKLASFLYCSGKFPYNSMTVREQAAIFGGPVSTHARWRKDVWSELGRKMGHTKALRQKSPQARAIYSQCQKGNRNRVSKKPALEISPSKSGI